MTSSRLSIRIVLADGSKLGPAKIALLEAIHAQGSISGAARAIGLDKIKIDRSFVDNMEREPEAFALVRALLGFGRGLGLTVTRKAWKSRRKQSLCSRKAANRHRAISIAARCRPTMRWISSESTKRK